MKLSTLSIRIQYLQALLIGWLFVSGCSMIYDNMYMPAVQCLSANLAADNVTSVSLKTLANIYISPEEPVAIWL
jgi:hypothetical protein